MHLRYAMEMVCMIRGEMYYAKLDPTVGSEVSKKRPVLVVSNNSNNKFSETITIIPITSNINKVFPFEVLLLKENSGLPKDSKAQCHQIRTISKTRIDDKMIGLLKNNEIHAVEKALKLHLNLQ